MSFISAFEVKKRIKQTSFENFMKLNNIRNGFQGLYEVIQFFPFRNTFENKIGLILFDKKSNFKTLEDEMINLNQMQKIKYFNFFIHICV